MAGFLLHPQKQSTSFVMNGFWVTVSLDNILELALSIETKASAVR
jgi:hypothetical protein